MTKLVLASSSAYRKKLLSRLALPFDCASPAIDESPLADEPPENLVLRLSRLKAQAVATAYPDHLIIGSDQVAVHNDQIITKPGNFERAFEQLSAQSGCTVRFLTGLCVADSASGRYKTDIVPTEVKFRSLTDREITRYLELEQPYDCAGSFKAEGLGITLFEWLHSDDPTALIGLPLIRLAAILRHYQLPPR